MRVRGTSTARTLAALAALSLVPGSYVAPALADGVLMPATPAICSSPTVTVTPHPVTHGGTVSISVCGFTPETTVQVEIFGASSTQFMQSVGSSGAFTTSYTPTAIGSYTVVVSGIEQSGANFEVVAGHDSEEPEPDPSSPTDPAEPDPSEPTDPAPSDPQPSDPEPSDPSPTDPEPTDPEPTDPAPTDPEPSEPAPSEPSPSNQSPENPSPAKPSPTAPEVVSPTPNRPTPQPAPGTSAAPDNSQPTSDNRANATGTAGTDGSDSAAETTEDTPSQGDSTSAGPAHSESPAPGAQPPGSGGSRDDLVDSGVEAAGVALAVAALVVVGAGLIWRSRRR